MAIQFILSLIGGAVAGGGLLLILGKYAYKWYKKAPLTITGEMVAIVSILVMTGVISAYKLAESSYHLAGDGVDYAKDGIQSVLETGQEVIEKTLKWGTVTLLEGVGQPLHDYQKKWEKDSIKPLRKVEINLLSSSEKIDGNKRKIHLLLDIINRGEVPLDVNKLFAQEIIVLTDKDGEAYSLRSVHYQDSTIETGEASKREIEIILPKEIRLQQLSSPMKNLLLL
jgi:hypothetical protein